MMLRLKRSEDSTHTAGRRSPDSPFISDDRPHPVVKIVVKGIKLGELAEFVDRGTDSSISDSP